MIVKAPITSMIHLHFERRSNPPERVDAAVETRSAFGDSEFAGNVVLRTVPVWLIGSEGENIQVNAFLDDGSDSTYVRDDVVIALGLETDDDNQLNQEEILALSKVEKSRRWIGGRYEVAISWKEEFPSLPDNREEAEKRLFSLEKNLLRKPEVARRYQEAMNANIERATFES